MSQSDILDVILLDPGFDEADYRDVLAEAERFVDERETER